MKHNTKETLYKVLKLLGVIFILGGVLNIARDSLSIAEVGGLAAYAGLNVWLTVLLYAPFLLAVLQIAIGIVTVVFSKRPDKANLLILLVVLFTILSLSANISILYITGSNPLVALAGLVLPAFYLSCLSLSKKDPSDTPPTNALSNLNKPRKF